MVSEFPRDTLDREAEQDVVWQMLDVNDVVIDFLRLTLPP